MKNRLIYVGMAALLALAFSGCNGSSSSDTTGGTTGGGQTKGGGGKKLHLAFVTNNSSDYWTIARHGVDKAKAELPDVDIDFQMPTAPEADSQRTMVQTMLTNGIDGIAISPVDPVNEADLINDAAAKTLVFTQDSDAPTTNRACYIGTDNVQAGHQLGDEIKKSIPGGGKVVIFVGKLDAQNAKERIQGVKDSLQGSNITILDTRTDDADHARAKTNVADILVKDPDVAGLIGIWSYNGPAILSAVEDAGKKGKVKILCFDQEDDTLRGISEGSIDATIIQQPFEFGYQGITDMVRYLKGDKSVIPADKRIIIPTRVINKSNVEDYKKELAQQKS